MASSRNEWNDFTCLDPEPVAPRVRQLMGAYSERYTILERSVKNKGIGCSQRALAAVSP
jgi:hypothetical protein